MRKSIVILLSLSLGHLAACGDDDGPTTDSGADAVVVDGGDDAARDAGDDAATTDAGDDAATDAGDDAGASDAGDDAAAADAGDDADMRDAGCTYLDSDFITDCDTGFQRLRHFVSTTGDAADCPEFYVLGGTRFDTFAEAMDSQSCVHECLRQARNSFTVLRCERRTGYISYQDFDGCRESAEVIDTADGIFRDSAEWNEAVPCP